MDKSAGDSSHLKSLVAEAEKAVADVKDPELKRVAFEKIMESLLSRQGGEERKEGAVTRRATRSGGKQPTERASKGPKGYLLSLVDGGFFKKPQTMAEILKALDERGHHLKHSDLTLPLQKLCDKVLRRKKEKVGKKKMWHYSNW